MPNNAKPYLKHQSIEVQPGSEHEIYIGPQTYQGVYVEPGGDDVLKLTARTSPNAPRTQHENEEFGGTRSPGATIAGVYPEIPFPCECYLQPAGSLSTGASLDSGDNPPQGDHLLRNMWGSVSLVNSQDQVTVGAVATHTADKTTFAVVDSSLFAVDDFIELVTDAANVSQSGPANGEVRRITVLNEGGANRLSVEPGFSKEPISAASYTTATADVVQGIRQYKPTKAWDAWLSARSLEGAVGKQITDVKGGGLSIGFSATEPIKITFDMIGLSMLVAGVDQARGESGNDSFAFGDTVLDVGDASKFEVGSFVDLIEITNATDTVLSTETSAEVTARDTSSSPNTLTLVRGGGTASSPTDLTIVTGVAEQTAETYDLTTKHFLRVRVDGQPAITLDASDTNYGTIAVPAAATAAEVVAILNKQMKFAKDYGYNDQGQFDVNWDAVFSDDTGELQMASQLFGYQSHLVVEDTGGADSAHDELFTGAFDIRAVEEVQIVPHAITAAELGTEIHGFTTQLNWGSYVIGVNSFNISPNNNPEVVHEMRNSPNPIGIIPGKTRSYDISCELLQRQDAARFFADEKAGTTRILHVQTIGDGAGYVVGVDASTAKIDSVEISGDDTKITMNLTISIQGTDEDEIVLFVG